MAARKSAKKAAKKPAKRAARRPKPKSAAKARPSTGGLALATASPSLTVNDLAKSLAWYVDVVGFVLEERWEEGGVMVGAQLLAGKVRFFVGQDDWKKGRDRKKGEGFRIYCQTTQDLDALAKKIVARGGTLDYEPRTQPWGSRDFGLTDPDGFKFTIATP
ncbi:MAG TPA: VOC family protein [Thermoanaerobaculia bacterium]|nr:VOC family protein [Thermoanaerobaculia bacterium]